MKKTVAGVARRSFYPESTLIERRATDELYFKYLVASGHGTRIKQLFDRTPYPVSSPDLGVLEELKQIGGLLVSAKDRAAMGGVDRANGVYLPHGSQNFVGLHVRDLKGPEQVRRDLHAAATYISLHEELRERPNVVGMTYDRLARFAGWLGFRKMTATSEVDTKLRVSLFIEHKVFRALNGKKDESGSFTPTIVYLPTDEFIDTFAPLAGPYLEADEPDVSIPVQMQAEPTLLPVVMPPLER